MTPSTEMAQLIAALGCLFLVVPACTGQHSYSQQHRYRQTYSSSSLTPTSSSVPLARFVPRYECRNVILPARSNIVPHGVVFTGHVDEIKPDMDYNDDSRYSATVTVRRVYYGPKNLRRQQVTVSGFGGSESGSGPESTWCHSNTQPGDSWLFITKPISYPDYFRLNSSLIKINLKNLERMEGLLNDEPFKKLTKVTELPCEIKYCENNANCINTERSFGTGEARCECLTFCKQTYAPVCGSNGETYTNECDLRLKSCYAGKNLFVKSLNTCPARQIARPSQPETTQNVWSSQTYRSQVNSVPTGPSRPNITSPTYSSYPTYRSQYPSPSSSQNLLPGQNQQSRSRVTTTTTTTTRYRPHPYISSVSSGSGYRDHHRSGSSPSMTYTYPNSRPHHSSTGRSHESWGHGRTH